MLRKSLLLTACLCILAAPAAFAAGDSNRYQAPPAGNSSIYNQAGACYTGLNGQGEVIDWAKNEMQCRTQTSGRSWIGDSELHNYDRSHR